jgi:hypothetical protein
MEFKYNVYNYVNAQQFLCIEIFLQKWFFIIYIECFITNINYKYTKIIQRSLICQNHQIRDPGNKWLN